MSVPQVRIDPVEQSALELALAQRAEAQLQVLRQQPTAWQRAALESGVSRRLA